MQRSTVVVVEDEPLLRLDAKLLLEDAGLEVVEFSNGDDAIDYVRDHKHEVAAIFTDVCMPGDTDGLELAAIVSEVCPDIAVLITSGQMMSRPGGLKPQVRYVNKPWTSVEVLDAMQSAREAA